MFKTRNSPTKKLTLSGTPICVFQSTIFTSPPTAVLLLDKVIYCSSALRISYIYYRYLLSVLTTFLV